MWVSVGFFGVMNRNIEGEFGSESWRQEVKKQRTSNDDTNPPTQPVASDEVDDVAEDLGRDDRHGESPSPLSMTEPSYS